MNLSLEQDHSQVQKPFFRAPNQEINACSFETVESMVLFTTQRKIQKTEYSAWSRD